MKSFQTLRDLAATHGIHPLHPEIVALETWYMENPCKILHCSMDGSDIKYRDETGAGRSLDLGLMTLVVERDGEIGCLCSEDVDDDDEDGIVFDARYYRVDKPLTW